jgi:hypothetical protein
MRHENMAATTHYIFVDEEQIRAGSNACPLPAVSTRAVREKLP